MFRKIHSNRDPKDTLFVALHEEFKTHFDKANIQFGAFAERKPKVLFIAMILLMLISVALSFTVFRHPATVPKPKASVRVAKPARNLNDGFDRILAVGGALQTTLHLRSEVEGLLAKPKLAHSDSLVLERALDSMGQIQHQINPIP